jgi:WYL domain
MSVLLLDQHFTPRPEPHDPFRHSLGGSARLMLDVGNDHALRSWILSFGPLARVVAPTALDDQILDELEAARERYAPKMNFEESAAAVEDRDAQRNLPFARTS